MNITLLALLQRNIFSTLLFSGEYSYKLDHCSFSRVFAFHFWQTSKISISNSNFASYINELIYFNSDNCPDSTITSTTYFNIEGCYITRFSKAIVSVTGATTNGFIQSTSIFNNTFSQRPVYYKGDGSTLNVQYCCIYNSYSTDNSFFDLTSSAIFTHNSFFNASVNNVFISQSTYTIVLNNNNFSFNKQNGNTLFLSTKLDSANGKNANLYYMTFGYNSGPLYILEYHTYGYASTSNSLFINNTCNYGLIYIGASTENSGSNAVIISCYFTNNVLPVYSAQKGVLKVEISNCYLDVSLPTITGNIYHNNNKENVEFEYNDIIQWKVGNISPVITPLPSKEFVCIIPAFSIWETPSLSPIETPTKTPTETSSLSPTETPSLSPIETPSLSPIETPTKTPTETSSLSPTETPSLSPIEIPTKTPTETPSLSPIETPSLSPIETPTETSSLSPTETPSLSPIETPTKTPTPIETPSLSPTETSSLSPIETPTKTPTETSSLSPTETPSLSPIETSTKTPTPIETPSLSPIETPSLSPIETPSLLPIETSSLSPTETSSLLPTETPNDTYPENPSISFSPHITKTFQLSSINVESISVINSDISCDYRSFQSFYTVNILSTSIFPHFSTESTFPTEYTSNSIKISSDHFFSQEFSSSDENENQKYTKNRKYIIGGVVSISILLFFTIIFLLGCYIKKQHELRVNSFTNISNSSLELLPSNPSLVDSSFPEIYNSADPFEQGSSSNSNFDYSLVI